MTTQGELPDIVERLRDVERRAIEFSQGWGAGGAHGKMMAAFAITEIERLRATHPVSPLEREGWKLVPIEPTQAMLDAVTASDQAWPFNDATMRGVYTAMVEDAPSPSPTEREGE